MAQENVKGRLARRSRRLSAHAARCAGFNLQDFMPCGRSTSSPLSRAVSCGSRRAIPYSARALNSPYLYTVLSGWTFKYKALEDDGRRQIDNYALPGDFIGLQASDPRQHRPFDRGLERCCAVRVPAPGAVALVREACGPCLRRDMARRAPSWLTTSARIGRRTAADARLDLLRSCSTCSSARGNSALRRGSTSTSHSRRSTSPTRPGSRWCTPTRRSACAGERPLQTERGVL